MKDKKSGLSRRSFLGTASTGFIYCGVGGSLAELLGGCEIHDEIPRIEGRARSFITPTDGDVSNDFYIQFGNPLTTPDNHPVISENAWSLSINGQVDNTMTVTFDDLMEAADTEAIVYMKTLRCVLEGPGVPYISNAYWKGVPLRYFLDEAELRDDAIRLRITGVDGFENNLRLSRVMDDLSFGVAASIPLLPVILAYEMNGQPIPSVHGGPVRIIVPEKFGFKQMKWPTEIEVSARDSAFGYYETVLFANDPLTDTGNMQLASVFTGPAEGETVSGPEVTFFGFAVFGPGVIEQVEVSVDGSAFQEAEIFDYDDALNDVDLFFGEVPEQTSIQLQNELDALRDELEQSTNADFSDMKPFVWVIWKFVADLGPGDHSARVRAVATGDVSQPDVDTVAEDGNSSIRSITFEVA
jgi:DMSO/TMAO reductase YedYZ molybdopterin-dependent catalytic subunit